MVTQYTADGTITAETSDDEIIDHLAAAPMVDPRSPAGRRIWRAADDHLRTLRDHIIAGETILPGRSRQESEALVSTAVDRRLATLRSIDAAQRSRQRTTILSLAGVALIIVSVLLGPEVATFISGLAR